MKKEIDAAMGQLMVGKTHAYQDGLMDMRHTSVKIINDAYGFKPIQTAPRDGTKIICASIGNSDIYDTVLHKTIPDPTLKVRWACTGMWSDKWNKFFDGVEPCGFANLTHWMEIPPVDDLNLIDVCQCKDKKGQPLMECDSCPR